MSQPELQKKVAGELDRLQLDYMLTGSIAAGLHGHVRATHDIDIVTHLPLGKVKPLVASFPPPVYYLDEGAIRAAMRDETMFNLIVPADDDKVDFWMLKRFGHDQVRFARRQQRMFDGVPLMVTTPEDTILSKLEWAKLSGGSEKQLFDCVRVYEVQFPNLDMAYLLEWIQKLRLDDLWQRLLRDAQP